VKFVTDLSKGVLGSPDSTELWTEITGHVPDEVLLKPGVKILSVACGHGTEAVILAKRMLGLGISKEKVRDAIWLIDKYYQFTNPARKIYGFQNVVTADFLTWETSMKFDVIVGNPPFQHPTNKSQKIWSNFVAKAGDLVDDKGYIAFVTPNSWQKKPNARAFKESTNVLSNGLLKLNTNCNHFFSVGEDVGYWVVQKEYQGTYDIVNLNQQSSGPYQGNPILFDQRDQLTEKIRQIFLKSQTLRDIKVIDFYYSTNQAIQQGKISTEKTKIFSVPVFISAAKEYYTKKEFITPCYKLILNKSGYYYSEPIEKYMVVPKTKWHGVGENGVGIPVNSTQEGIAARSIYSLKLFRFYIDNEKSSGFNSGLLDLPVIDLSKKWNDQKIYKYFGLTQKEIEYVESHVN
jgi:SAM-dependent methyltransferase